MEKPKKERHITRSMVSFNKVLFLLVRYLQGCSDHSMTQIINRIDYFLIVMKLLHMTHIKRQIDRGKFDLEFPSKK